MVLIPTSVSEPFLYLFSSKNAIFHKFLYRTFWYSRNYTYFYFPKWRYKPRMVLKITNLHILRYLPTYWLYLLECYTIANQRCTHTASRIWTTQLNWTTLSLVIKASRQTMESLLQCHCSLSQRRHSSRSWFWRRWDDDYGIPKCCDRKSL